MSWWDGAVAGATGGSVVPGWGTLIGAGIGLFGQLFGAHEQASAADEAAKITAASQKYSADLAAKAQADALAFNERSGENAYANNEVGRQTNYAWQAARDRRLGFIGDEVGLPARETPAFIPGVDPHFTGPAGTTGAPAAAPAGANYQPLILALNGGQSPDAVIASFNKAQGLPNGASYAWRAIPEAPGGGVVEIPGGSYLAPGPDGKWGWSAGASGQAATQPTGMLAPYSATYQPAPFNYSVPVAQSPGMFAAY